MKPQTLGKRTLLLTMAVGALTARTTMPPMANPGTVNYTEGSVTVNGTPITDRNTKPTLHQHQTLSTALGKAEILLSPGSILRVGNNSEIRMLAPDLVNPRFEVVRGSAMLEVDRKADGSNITVLQRDATVSILKKGLYRFDSDAGRVSVLDGKLELSEKGHTKKIGKGDAIALDPARKPRIVFLDSKAAKDELYAWSQIRSESLAGATAAMLPPAYSTYGAYRGDGWYWNPAFSTYSWLPGDGYFYSPFGYPFYGFGYGLGYGFGYPYYGYYGGPRYIYRPRAGFGYGYRSNIGPRTPGSFGHSGGGFGRGSVGGFRGGGGHSGR